MVEYKLGDQPFSVPTGWHEVTVSQFQKYIEAKGNLTKIISAFTGLDYDLLYKTVRPKEQNDLLILSVAFAKDNIINELLHWPLPDTFTIGGKTINYKDIDITKMCTGQYNAFIAEAAGNPIILKDKYYVGFNNVSAAIAVYCYPEWSGKEFTDDWTDMLPVIEKELILPCYAVASFFLNRFLNVNATGPAKPNTNLRKPKSKRASKN